MDRYAIYTYHFKDAPVEGDWTESTEVTRPDISDEQRRIWLDRLFGEKNNEFSMKKLNKHDADCYPCTVLAHPERIILLRLERPKVEKVWEKHESERGEAARIAERNIPSFPYIYILIDCREKCKGTIAISIDSNAWRSTDKVADLLKENIDRLLASLSRGFIIKIKPELLQLDFVSHSRRLIKKQRLSVKKMTIYFTRGMINPKVEEIINGDTFIKGLLKRMYQAQHGELTLWGPEGDRIIDGRSSVFEHLVMLVGSDPQAEPFRLSMSYSDGSTYSCGKDIRMEFQMDDMAFMSLFGEGSLFPEHEMGAWFDGVAKQIEEQRNAEQSKQKRPSTDQKSLWSGGTDATVAIGM